MIIIPLGILSLAFYNGIGLFITKYTDGTTRAMMTLVKTIFIWIIGIIVTL
jgi:hypothetical protein